MTLKELAERSGVSLSMIWRIERQAQAPSTRTLEKLARALGCSVTDLIEEPHPNKDAMIFDLIRAVESNEMSAQEAVDTLVALGVVSRRSRTSDVGGDMAKAG